MNKHIILSSLIFLVLLLIAFNSFSYSNNKYEKTSLYLKEEKCKVLKDYSIEITKLKYLDKSKYDILKKVDFNDERAKDLIDIVNYIYDKDINNRKISSYIIEVEESSSFIYNECLNK